MEDVLCVSVKDLSGRLVELPTMFRTSTLREVAQEVESLLEIPFTQQRFLCGEQQLPSDLSLSLDDILRSLGRNADDVELHLTVRRTIMPFFVDHLGGTIKRPQTGDDAETELQTRFEGSSGSSAYTWALVGEDCSCLSVQLGGMCGSGVSYFVGAFPEEQIQDDQRGNAAAKGLCLLVSDTAGRTGRVRLLGDDGTTTCLGRKTYFDEDCFNKGDIITVEVDRTSCSCRFSRGSGWGETLTDPALATYRLGVGVFGHGDVTIVDELATHP